MNAVNFLLNLFEIYFSYTQYLLSVTKDYHGLIHIEEFIIETSKNRDLEQYKKEQEKLNLLG
jgi:hypothetical protein